MNDLGLDSLDQVELIMAMEDEFGKWLKLGVLLSIFILFDKLSTPVYLCSMPVIQCLFSMF